MAEKDKKKEDKPIEGEAEALKSKSGGKKKIIIIAVVALLLVGAVVGAALFTMNLLSDEDETAMNTEKEVDEKETFIDEDSDNAFEGPAIYYPMKPAIVVNFQDRGRQRFLQAELTLMLRDESIISSIEIHMPMLRNSMVMLFGGQVYSELQTAEGKSLLQEEALEEIQALLKKETGQTGIEQVLFTSFVMQ